MSQVMPLREREISDPNEESSYGKPGEPLVIWALRQMKDAEMVVEKWRKAAEECDTFKAGKHFSKADSEKLNRQGRPTAAFNVAQKFVRFISGLERRSLQEVRFLPRDMMDSGSEAAAELVTKAFEWVLQQCNGNDERSRAFEDMLVRGMGWTDVRFDRSMTPSGEIVLTRIDGREMMWDINAQQSNMADARWVARTKQVPKEIALQRWPDAKVAIMSNTGTRDLTGPLGRSILRSEREAVPQEYPQWPGVQQGMVQVTEFQWYDEVPGILFITPEGKDEWLDEDNYPKYRAEVKKLYRKDIGEGERLLMRQYQRMLLCGRTMIAGPHKLPGKGFTLNCMTGQWDADEHYWYGYMRLLMDPQKYLTKFINQVMEIITRTAKGGLLAELDAFVNVTQAEERYAQAGSITWLNSGGLAKVQEKSVPQIPPASIEMFRVCTEMLKEVTGVNPEISMGVGAADQPAMTMQQRQLASIALLATEFAALERYRIREARTVCAFLPLIADDRIIRVGGAYDSQSLQLARDPFFLDYDVVLDEDTRDPNVRQSYMNTIREIAPTLIRTGNFLPSMIKFFPLPASFKHELMEAIKQQQEAAAQAAQQGGGGKGGPAPDDPREVEARIQKLQADAVYQQTKAATLVEQMKNDQLKARMDHELRQSELANDAAGKQADAQIRTEEVATQRELAKSQLMKNVIEGAQTAAQNETQQGLPPQAQPPAQSPRPKRRKPT